MQVLSVKREEHECGIPLKGLDSVKTALTLFFEGGTKDAHATTRQLEKDADASGHDGGLVLAFKTLAEAPRADSFLDQLFKGIEAGVVGRGFYSRHYDYDGVGPFFKTSVEVNVFDPRQNLYVLELYAAYVGDKVEAGLAEALGVERGLMWLAVEKEMFAHMDDMFRIDFDEVLRRLNGIFDLKGLTGKKIATMLVTRDEDRITDPLRPVLFQDKDFTVTMYPDDVDYCFQHPRGKPEPVCMWSAKGSVLSGPLRKSYTEDGKFQTPLFKFSIASNKGLSYRRLPVLDPAVKTRMRELASRIEAAFTEK